MVQEQGSLVEGCVSRRQEVEVEGSDAVVEGQPALHLPALGEAVDGHVRPVMAEQRRHVALHRPRDKGWL